MSNNNFKKSYMRKLFIIFFLGIVFTIHAQTSNQQSTNGVTTYLNPIQPGDHPDQTLMRVGNDFYSTGSSFHNTAYVPILHSTDLVHWEIISRVVPSNWPGLTSDGPAAGIWQGALAQFGGYFWVYYSNGAGSGQYFSKALNLAGPWFAPTKVTASTVTGYDNSIFVDDDGTPYMLMKNGQAINRMQQIDKTTGQLTGTLMNMDWINANNRYSWAEGPVMCKRNGRYYMFVAGDVSGGQFTLSSATLTATESAWTLHGNFFSAASNPGGFTGPNHISQPIQLDDGTWWCISHAYNNSGWKGQGRLGLLHQVIWDANGVPHGIPPSTSPVAAPNLPNTNNILMNLPKEDYFTSSTLNINWHFFNKTNATKYSLTANPGYMRLSPGTGTTHILQKEGGHFYTMVTKVDVNATTTGNQAGLRIMNGKDDLYVTLYSGFNGTKKIGFAFNGTTTEVNNTIGNIVWLKIDRENHLLKGFYSADGKTWTQVGNAIDVSTLDNFNTNWNEWVGNSIGLYATGINADFDYFKYRDGLSAIKVAGYNNFYGVTTSTKTPGTVVSNSASGDWFMLGGVSMSDGTIASTTIEINAASATGNGNLEVWIDNIGGSGTKIATIPITTSGGADVWKNYTANVNVKGQHDLYFKFIGSTGVFSINTIKFIADAGAPAVSITAPLDNTTLTLGNAFTINANASDADGTISKVEFYAGTTIISTDNTSPYSINWTPTSAGTYSITAIATDNTNKATTSNAITLKVLQPQGPYQGKAWPIPGTIQFENYDVGGNGFAYQDGTAGSAVTPVVNFRTDEDVDIENCTDIDAGYNIGYATAGEWLEYTVNIATTGSYTMDLRVACNGDGRTLSVSIDGSNIATDVAIPNTTGWQTWQTVSIDKINLSAGQKIMRVTIGATDYINLNYVTFTADSVPIINIQTPFNGMAHQIPGRIEAEEYDLGGEGVAFHEADANGNQGLALLRNDDVDIETTGDTVGDYNIGYILQNEWLEYSVNVTATGNYDIDLRLAANGDGKTMHIEMDGVDITGSVVIPNTTGWQIWQTSTVRNISLTQGSHIMRIVFDASYFNINYVEFIDATTTKISTEEIEDNIIIYQNPLKNQLLIKNEQLKNNKEHEIIIITNTLGQVVFHSSMLINNSSFQIDISQFQTGLYFITVGNQTNKIIFK